MRQALDIDGSIIDGHFDDSLISRIYELMVRTRAYDRRAMALQRQGRLGTYPPSEGQEAAQIGSVLALGPDDWVYPAYREHGAELAMGMPMEVMLGYWRGLPNPDWNPHVYRVGTLTVPIGSNLPHAVGHAYEARRAGQPVVTMAYLGDGATSSNDFHAALTFAGVWATPTVFLCQNNQYAISTHISAQTAAAHLVDKAVGYGIEGVLVDGMDALAVYEATREAVDRARRGDGPTFIEAVCYRFGPHATADDPTLYRRDEDVEQWRLRDPLSRIRRLAERRGLDLDVDRIDREASQEADEAIRKLEARPEPVRGDAVRHVMSRVPETLIRRVHTSERAHDEPLTEFSERERFRPEEAATGSTPRDATEDDSGTATMTMAEAISSTIDHALSTDPRTVILGEDVGATGGVFRITAGMQERYGPERVIDTPLNESGIVGTAIGMAIAGGRPIAEIQFDGFVFPAMDQIVSHLARLRYRSRGAVSVPVVVRMPSGAGIRAHEHHCDSPEAYFAHTPGLTVLMPSNPYDAKGLLTAAIASDDPVIFLEPKVRYRGPRGPVPLDPYTIPIGRAAIVTEGHDVTVVTYGGMVGPAAAAAQQVREHDGATVEVVDLRTLYPWDEESVLASVANTGRLVLVQEAPATAGMASEVAATVAEHALYDLTAPIIRVCGFDTPIPHFAVEHHGLVDVADIADGIRRALAE